MRSSSLVGDTVQYLMTIQILLIKDLNSNQIFTIRTYYYSNSTIRDDTVLYYFNIKFQHFYSIQLLSTVTTVYY